LCLRELLLENELRRDSSQYLGILQSLL
jgi:hypothetical protein